MHGQFVWYELLTPDSAASKKFYGPLTGWSTEAMDKDYSMWTLGGEPVGGIFQMGPAQAQQGVPPNWLPYVEANNVDELARLASTLGGKTMHEPTDIPGHGRFAVLLDPQGAAFGVYKPNGASRSWAGTPTIGHFSWHELMTSDSTAAFDFYRKLFGWEKTSDMDMGPEVGKYQMYGLQGKQYGGMYNRSGEMAQVPPFWLPYVFVKDVHKAMAAAKKSGAEVVNGPMEVPGGDWIVVMKDPQGAAFALHSGAHAATSSTAKAAKPKGGAKKKPAAKAMKPAAKKGKATKSAKTAKAKARPKTKAKSAKAKRPAKKAKTTPKPRARAKSKSRR